MAARPRSRTALVVAALALAPAGGLPACSTRPAATRTAASAATTSGANGLPACPSATATGCDRDAQSRRGSSACRGTGPRPITATPLAIADIAFLQPMGLMIGGHVTPIDHGYIYIKGASAQPPREAAVYAPLDGIVTRASSTERSAPGGAAVGATISDVAVSIDASCTFRVRFSNMVRFAGRLADAVGHLGPNDIATPNLAVKAGELIGYTGLPTAQGIDVWVEDDDVTLTGFVRPEQYTDAEAWKLHMVDLFDRADEPVKSQLLALVERDARPRWGTIDHDIDGKLVGNWFRVGSGGYGGRQRGREGYWEGHLAVVPDGNDPSQLVISFGSYGGSARQFAAIANAPDPATVGVAMGLVKYELGQIEYVSGDTGAAWDRRTYLPHLRTRAQGDVAGTVLLQMVDGRHLRMQVFPGRRAASVAGFDAGALMYER